MEPLIAIVLLGVVGLLLTGAVMGFIAMLRINGLERTIRKLREQIGALQAEFFRHRTDPPSGISDTSSQAASIPEPPPVEPPTSAPVDFVSETAEPTPPPPPTAATVDLESIIAGKWLNRVGIVAVLIATAFFLKLAFDNQWIGPTGRVAIGLVAGIALLVGSEWLLRRGYRYFSEGITALGGGVLFLALYAAWDYYQLLPLAAALVGMVATTGALAWIAGGRDSERLAVLALGAGLLAPALLLRDADQHVALFAYLAVLIPCFLVLAWRQWWRAVAPLALLGMLLHGVPWFIDHYAPAQLFTTLGFAFLLFVCFVLYAVLCARRGRSLDYREIFLPLVNAAWFGVALHVMLYDDHRWALTIGILVLGAIHLAALLWIGERDDEPARATRLVLGGVALTCLTAAVPIRLDGMWITIAWAVEATALVWAGFEARIKPLRAAGIVLFAAVAARLLEQDDPTSRLFLNRRFASFLVAGAGLGASAWWARQRRAEFGTNERHLFQLLGIGAIVIGVWSLSVELWYAIERWRPTDDLHLTQQLGLSLLWTLLAALLIREGMRRGSKILRIQGLALLGLTVVKVFVSDLSFLDNVYRIASFLVLGIVLLAVSFKYQRSLARQAEDGSSAGREPD